MTNSNIITALKRALDVADDLDESWDSAKSQDAREALEQVKALKDENWQLKKQQVQLVEWIKAEPGFMEGIRAGVASLRKGKITLWEDVERELEEKEV